jgi:hypothetical protein
MICTDCEIEDGYTETLWTAGGDRIGDYREAKEEVCLCDNCASLYGICEECGALIADEVFVPPGGDLLCPDCRKSDPVFDNDEEASQMTTQLPTIALSVRQPWAWLICHGGKGIENRTWPTRFRGRFLVHAAKGMTLAEYEACQIFVDGFDSELAASIPDPGDLDRGGIVGAATLVLCVRSSASEWFCGPWGFVLSEVAPLPFRPCKGALGFFRHNAHADGAVAT